MKRNYYPFLDGLRALGFMFVYVAHIGQKYKTFYIAGKVGVTLFFIISSFLFSTYFISHVDLMNTVKAWIVYAFKRILKLYPIYVFVLLIEFVVGNYSFSKVLSHLFLLDARQHYWTIPVMIQFYLLIPFVIFLLKKILKKGTLTVLSLLFFIFVISGIFYSQITLPFLKPTANQINILFYIPSFIIGIIMSLVYLTIINKKIQLSRSLYLFMLYIPIIVLIVLMPHSYKMFSLTKFSNNLFLPFSIFGFLWSSIILSLLLFKSNLCLFFENKIIRYLGIISYSAYLIHIVVIKYTYLILPNSVLIGTVAGFIIVVSFSSLLYKFIEKPASNLSRIFIKN